MDREREDIAGRAGIFLALDYRVRFAESVSFRTFPGDEINPRPRRRVIPLRLAS